MREMFSFTPTPVCHQFCHEMRRHTHECIERQLIANPVFKSYTEPRPAPTVRTRIAQAIRRAK